MKHILSVILCAAIGVSVAACGQSHQEEFATSNRDARLFIDLAIHNRECNEATKNIDFSKYTVGILSPDGEYRKMLYEDMDIPFVLSPGEYKIWASSTPNLTSNHNGLYYYGEKRLRLNAADIKGCTIEMMSYGFGSDSICFEM